MTEARARSAYPAEHLDRLVNPRRIAIVGASERPGSFGARTLENLAGFTGEVVGVNPNYTEVLGRPCVPSLVDLPEAPDAVIVCTPRTTVEETLAQAAKVQAGGAVVYASGFAETGKPDRIEDQARLVELAQTAGMPVAGPNCVGLVNVRSGAAMNFMNDCGAMIEGHTGSVAIISQSGALGYTVLQGMVRGVGFSHYLAAGNSADVEICDYIVYCAAQPEVRAIVCLFEGIKDGERFIEAAKIAQHAGKPVIAYKAGNAAVSRQAAMSHTGTMTGSLQAYNAAFAEAGVVVVNELEAVLEYANLFAKAPAPRHGRTVGIMATSGGAGVINADKAEEHGLQIPELAPKTREVLSEVVPDFGSVRNPADLTAEVLKDSATFESCIRAFADDPGFSAVIVPLVFAHPGSAGLRSKVITDVAAATDAAVITVWMNDWLEGPGSAHLDADPRVPLFRSPGRCMAAIDAWVAWHEQRDRAAAAGEPARVSPVDAPDHARRIIEEETVASGDGTDGSLREDAAKRVLEAYGIATTRGRAVATPEDAAAAAAEIGFPVVVKIDSADLPHKSDVGGVRLGLGSVEEVREAADAVLASARRHAPQARIDGVIVEPMVSSAFELVVGVSSDAQFGPILLVGHGGVWVEVMHDVAQSLVPVTRDKARELLSSLRCYPLLTGHRGAEPLAVEAAVDLICRVSELADDLRDVVVELDANPILMTTTSAVAADALIRSAVPAPVAAGGAR